MDKRFQITHVRHNLELALAGLKKQLGVTKNPSEISRIQGEITELQKYLTFGTRKEKKWS